MIHERLWYADTIRKIFTHDTIRITYHTILITMVKTTEEEEEEEEEEREAVG